MVGTSVGGTAVGAGVAAGAHAANTIEATTTKPNRVGQRIARNIFFLLPNWIYYFLARLGLFCGDNYLNDLGKSLLMFDITPLSIFSSSLERLHGFEAI
jgi:hypothetical protein